ncbi:MAG: ABC transporter permease [Candidatus Bathyarchaeia archaeon]|jgi:putative ABC transport system permease protein
MRIGDILESAWTGVKSRKFRFVLNLIGILIGCAAVTGLVSLTQGLSNNISMQLGTLGASTITVSPGGAGTSPFGGGTSSRTLNYKDVNQIARLSDVSLVSPTDSGGLATYEVAGKTYNQAVTGVTDLYFDINQAVVVESGRALIRTDSASAVIGASVALPTDATQPVIAVGDRIKITSTVNGVSKELTVRVVGILKKTGGSFGSSDSVILIPITTFDQFYERAGKYSAIQVLATSPDLVDTVSTEIKNNLSEIRVITAAAAQSVVSSITGVIQEVLGGIAAISLVVAGVGIINTMTISVMERTREIGILKALGAKGRDVLVLFLSEAVLTGIVGGIVGAGLGFVVSIVAGNIIGLSPAINIYLGLMVVGFAIVTCVLSGLYPAWRASRMNPVEALRYE